MATPFTPDTANLVLETTAELVNAITAQNDKKLDDLIKIQTDSYTRTLRPMTLPPTLPATSARTNVLTASTTILAFLSKNVGNSRPMLRRAPPTGNPWQITSRHNRLDWMWGYMMKTPNFDGMWGYMMKTPNFGNREQLTYLARRLDHRHTSQLVKTALLDSGATSHFNKPSDNLPITGPSHKTVAVAFGQEASTTASAMLSMTQLYTPACQTHILPALSPNSLLSVGTFANHRYVTIFHEGEKGTTVHDRNDITITSKRPSVLQGCRDEHGLCRLPLAAPTSALHPKVEHSLNNVYDLPSTTHTIRYLQAALGFPTKNTLLAAIRNGNLTTFPGLTAANAMKHFPESDETQKGHMKQNTNPTTFHTHARHQTPEHLSPHLRCHKKDDEHRSNRALSCHLTTRMQISHAYQTIHQRWKDYRVINVNCHVLDNEAPHELKAAIRSNGCTVKLTPPSIHQPHNAKRAIQTFKSHFITILAGVDNSFPINKWDSLLPQTILTLNLLRNANVAPKISAYAYHHRPFDYDRMPLAPIECAVQFHVKSGRRRTWGEHPLMCTLSPTVTPQPPAPRVTFQDTVQLRTFDPNSVTPLAHSVPTQLNVESPVIAAPWNTSPDIKRPRLSVPSTTNPSADNTSIAAHIALRRCTVPSATNDSIAARLLARRRDSAHTVIDMETSQALKYRQLLRHPKFKDAWTPMNSDALHKV
eukprot:CCRYP_004762-RA/>CCRYP_004762-RA protein AED:0.30 eAED:0.26 QI:0/0/0/1/1/1/4/0/702